MRWDDHSEIKCVQKTVTRETDVQVCTHSTGKNREVVLPQLHFYIPDKYD